MENKGEKTDENILYELLTFAEWNQNFDNGLQKITLNNSVSNTCSNFNPWRIFSKSKLDNKKYLQTEYAWQLAVSQDGKVIAILQDALLEIRTAKDGYSSVVGKAPISVDQCPQLRKITWSSDNTFLAVGRDNGIVNIYNLLGCITATIQPNKATNSKNDSNYVLQPVIGLLFLQPKFKTTKWSNELYVFYHSGEVKSILLSSLDGCESEENLKFSLDQHFPLGITSVAYNSFHHTIIIAGPCQPKEHGITVWRILNDHPYLKIAIYDEKKSSNSRSFLRFIPGYSTQFSADTVIKMKVSPNGEILACLHYSGEISFWQLPGIRLIKRWPLPRQPHYNILEPRLRDNVKSEEYFFPVDICWWSDMALVIARRSGAITVCSTSTLNNLLGDNPEFLSASPQISSIYGPRSAVVALECEVENNLGQKIVEDPEETETDRDMSVLQASIQAALYSFTDIERFEPKRKTPRITQRTYRLLALKRTTPEELYARKIEIEDYESALSLANTYSLDCDLVYQKQWRTSNVSRESIYDYLDKVKKICWVLNECIERVPDTIYAAKELLDFGLKKTELDEEERKDLDQEKMKIISFRRQILLYSDNLSLYQKIIEDPSKYNAFDYDQFRRKSAIMNTVGLARQEKWMAVATMFTYRGNDVLKHRLPILSNFPETLLPMQYRSLLPEIVDNDVVGWEVNRLRYPDWSEEINIKKILNECDSSGDFIYEDNPFLRRFETENLTPQLVEEWYVRRTYEIEKHTGLVDYALSFATFGKERNVKAVEPLLFNLKTLHTLVYIVQDQEITLSKLEALKPLEQAKLLLSKTNKMCFIKDMSNILYPFALRCDKQGRANFYSIIKGLILDLSEESLDLPLQLFKYLKEEKVLPFKLTILETMSLALDCLYKCSKPKQVENGYMILECLPVRGTRMTAEEEELHDKIDRLEKHLEICEILEQYKVSKPLRYLLENEENKQEGMLIMHNMATFTKDETLNFSDLLQDLMRIRSEMFNCVEESFCHELVAFTLMTCECEEIILSAEDLLQCNKDESDKAIPLERSIHLVLEAAKIHFERATNYDDVCIKLSQLVSYMGTSEWAHCMYLLSKPTCLNLVSEPHPKICEELDIIESLQLLQDFDVKLLPLQVRNCTDKMKLIESCLEANPKAYESCQRLLQLSHALRIYNEDRKRREGEVLILSAQYALKALDYEYCSKLCDRLVSRNYSPAWPVVRSLAEQHDYQDNSQKREFLAFAILHCPVENLEELIEFRLNLNPPLSIVKA